MAIAKVKIDPANKWDFGFNYNDPKAQGGPYLLDGETITDSTWALYDGDWNPVSDVTIGSATNTGSITTVFFGPADDVDAIRGEIRFLTNHTTTNQGREADRSYQFTFEEQ